MLSFLGLHFGEVIRVKLDVGLSFPGIATRGQGIFRDFNCSRNLVLCSEAISICLHFHGFETVDAFKTVARHGKMVKDPFVGKVFGEAVKSFLGCVQLRFHHDKNVPSLAFCLLGWFNTGEKGNIIVVSYSCNDLCKGIFQSILDYRGIKGAYAADGDSNGI